MFIEKLTKSYGIATNISGREVVQNIIFKDTCKPAHGEKVLRTTENNQTIIKLKVYENNSFNDVTEINDGTPMYESCEVVLQPGLPVNAPVKVIFDVDENGVLDATALDMIRGKPCEVRVKRIGV